MKNTFIKDISIVTVFLLIFGIGSVMAFDYKEKMEHPEIGMIKFNIYHLLIIIFTSGLFLV